MQKSLGKDRTVSIGQALLLLVLLGMLLFAFIWAVGAWNSADGGQMSVHGWIALGLGTTFSLLIGCGLMILMFYSSRSGYDDVATPTVQQNPSVEPDQGEATSERRSSGGPAGHTRGD